ncbi:MAG TPA: class I poly(R)-hydroxyalkanoic acid synthase [Hyphomicrobiaceae bacterium]|jgi:polyhydroxyalkanoate synthase|nr:class I poly(R)-hydroxyalkanoic acid synthase [Hyphomicrobiaceae bacterium]
MQQRSEEDSKPVSAAFAAKVDLGAYRIADPEAFGRNILRLMEEGTKALNGFLDLSKATPAPSVVDWMEAAKLFQAVAQPWVAQPARLVEAQAALLTSYMQLMASTAQRAVGAEVSPVAEPDRGDNRFADPEWSRNPYFDFWKQAYLITTRWLEDMLDKTEGLDERTRQRANFYLKQIVTAFSPSNFPLTNPVVMRETAASSAENLVQGMANLVHDVQRSGALLSISQTDVDAFEVGRNIATAPGKVIFQNDVIQLIQYAPTTEKVHARPLLIVPPWINKFYILDLGPEKSFIHFIVSKGFTVFVVSWVNPDARHALKTFEDYMREGILAATEAVQREIGADKVNVIGYCVGGTLLGTTLAYLAAREEEPFSSATFFAAQVDFTNAGDLMVFIDDAQLKALEEMMAERGYLDAGRMAAIFNMLRPKDLIWSYVVNNYLLGKKPFPFDLLFWNQDSTRLPATNHKFYLREFYQENKLARGQMTIGNVKLDLGAVKLPIYELCAKEDHIAPAKSVFIGSRLFGGPVTYVLAGSGHIAGVINPPSKSKYQYWTNSKRTATLEAWMEGAQEHPGSWWPHYAEWLVQYSGDLVPARQPGAKLGEIEDAPGSYVKVKA